MTDDEIAAQKMMQPARDTMAREELRDKFAMAALTGILVNIESTDSVDRGGLRKIVADAAYRVADAMLEARKAKP